MILNLKLAHQSLCMTVQFMMVHHHTKFGYKWLVIQKLYHPDKYSQIFQTFTVFLTLNTAIQSVSKTLTYDAVPSD